jgi:hypothetical protein
MCLPTTWSNVFQNQQTNKQNNKSYIFDILNYSVANIAKEGGRAILPNVRKLYKTTVCHIS